MNRVELTYIISEETGISKEEAKKALESIIRNIAHTLEDGNTVKLQGFGSWNIVPRGTRKGRNPTTGQEISLPARNNIKFRPGNLLKQKINELG